MNFDTEDNRIENLGSVSAAVNTQQARDHYSNAPKNDKPHKPNTLGVVEIDDRGRIIQYYPSISAAVKDRGVCYATVYNHIAGVTETCKGGTWFAFEDGMRLGRILPPLPSNFATEQAFYKFNNLPDRNNGVRFSRVDILLKQHLLKMVDSFQIQKT